MRTGTALWDKQERQPLPEATQSPPRRLTLCTCASAQVGDQSRDEVHSVPKLNSYSLDCPAGAQDLTGSQNFLTREDP